MMNNIIAKLGIGVCLFSTTSAQAAPIPIEEQIEAVVSHLVGTMDTSAQAATNPDRVGVRMTTCRVQLVKSDRQESSSPSVYLYQEQALIEKLNQPYRQRFLRIGVSDDGLKVESKSFKLLNREPWIGQCNKPADKRLLQSSEFGESVCSVFLKPVITIYIGETQPGGCSTNVRGAVTITNRIILHATGMDTWDRGFDANGDQVWGAIDKSFQFRWLEE